MNASEMVGRCRGGSPTAAGASRRGRRAHLPDAAGDAWAGLEPLEPRLLLSGGGLPFDADGKTAAQPIDSYGADPLIQLAQAGENVDLDRMPAGYPFPPPPVIITNATVVEGDSGTRAAVFDVYLGGPTDRAVTFDFATVNGSATAGTDYVYIKGTVVLLPGEPLSQIRVPIIGDTLYEAAETFQVVLSNFSWGVPAGGVGVGIIVDDDPMPSLSIDDVAVLEGNYGGTYARFTVTLSAPSGREVWFTCSIADGTARAGSDYRLVNFRASFDGHETTHRLGVLIYGDTIVEPTEDFYLDLSDVENATIADGRGVCQILTDEVRTLDFAGRAKAEFADANGDPVTVSLAGPGSGQVGFASRDADCDAGWIVLDGTTDKSSLTISTKGRDAETEIGDIFVHGPIRQITASTTDLVGGRLTVEGGLGGLALDDVRHTYDGAAQYIDIGESGNPRDAVTMSFDCVSVLRVESRTPIRSVKAATWESGEISAPSLGSLTIAGDRRRDIAGDCYLDLSLHPDTKVQQALGNVRIAGSLSSVDGWYVYGTVGTASVGGQVHDWRLHVFADAPQSVHSLSLGDVKYAEVDVDGGLGTVRAARWLDGKIEARTLKSLTISGDKRNQISGDFGADLELTDEAGAQTLGKAQIAGELREAEWWVAGHAGSISVGSVGVYWDGPAWSFGGDVKSFTCKGDLGRFSWTSNSLGSLRVQGTMSDVSMTLTQPPDPKRLALGSASVNGIILDSEILSAGNIGKVTAAALDNADIFAGLLDRQHVLPDPNVCFDVCASIKALNIKGYKGERYSLVDSNIAAWELGRINTCYARFDNDGVPFGVSCRTLTKFTYKDADISYTWPSWFEVAAPAQGDFKVWMP